MSIAYSRDWKTFALMAGNTNTPLPTLRDIKEAELRAQTLEEPAAVVEAFCFCARAFARRQQVPIARSFIEQAEHHLTGIHPAERDWVTAACIIPALLACGDHMRAEQRSRSIKDPEIQQCIEKILHPPTQPVSSPTP